MRCLNNCLVWLLVVTGLAAPAQAEEPIHYAIRMNDNLIGYATITAQPARHADQPADKLTCETLLKVALLGKEQQTLLASETWLAPNSTRPLFYKQTNTVNEDVRHFELDFQDDMVRSWFYRSAASKGQPTEVSLPQDCFLLGGNNFAHWRQLMRYVAGHATQPTVTVSVYVPDSKQVQSFQFVRGSTGEVEIGGQLRACTEWRLEVANMTIQVDAETGEFLQMLLPAQRTSITRADAKTVKLAEKAQAEEVLARHFKQSNTLFDDYLQVRQLAAKVEVQVIGESVANDASVLTTVMQDFSGRKEREHISGEVVVRSRRYDGENAPAFPVADSAAELESWLQPSTYIECDDPEIKARAAELVEGAKSRWEATLKICRWVEREIRYQIADTPSARLALDKRSGDCGPHSTLSVAMLRANNIPAKLVGGLLYTPTFGGSFGQHAWIEVHMGPDGWIPLDPTTGEFESLNATHIKLFEGMGGVLPETVEVLSFQPPNREQPAFEPAAAKPLPWKLGKDYAFAYTQGGQSLGKESFRVDQVEHEGQQALRLHSSLELNVGGVKVAGPTQLTVSRAALPLAFKRELDQAGNRVILDCRFAANTVQVKVSGAANLNRQLELQPGTYCFDNNLMSSFVLICSQLDYEVGKTLNVRTFHPSSLQVIPLTFRVKGLQKVKVSGHELECYECDVQPIKNTFWITTARQFVKVQQGNLVIELTSSK